MTNDDGERERDVVTRRRARLMTAAMSTVTLTAASAGAQVCLSVARREPVPCSSEEAALPDQPTPAELLGIGECYETRERDLDKALTIYARFMEITEGQRAFDDDRKRTKWRMGRIESVLAAERAPATVEPASPPPEPNPPPADVEIIANPAPAPRTGGAAGCGCEMAGAPPEGAVAGGLALLLGALVGRRRRR